MRHGLNDFARSSSAAEPLGEPHSRLESNHHLVQPAGDSETIRPEPRGRWQLAGLLSQCGQAACVFVPVLAILASRDGSVARVTLAFVVASVWLIAIDLANSSAWFSPLALGTRVTSTLGVFAAVPAVVLVDDLFPGYPISPFELALTTAAVAASAIAFWDMATGEPKVRRVLVVGAAGGGLELVHQLDANPSLPFSCLGLVADAPDGNGHDRLNEDGTVLGTIFDLTEIVRRQRPDLVVFAGSGREEAMSRLLDACPADLRVLSLPDFYEHAFGFVPIEHVSSMWFMSMVHLYRRPYPRAVKTLFDLGLASFGLLLCLPLMVLIALLVRSSGPGPILYRQMRVGEGGRLFEILKFRTMVQDAEKPGVAIWATSEDKRVTSIGRRLRRTRLDELPQLWNVLRGEMSVVGPRPERPEFVSSLEELVPHWTRRTLVKPGITGWAQVRVGYTSDSVSAVNKLSYDLYYLKHRSLLLDLAIAAKTGAILFSGAGAK